jgi:hypothetical protein
MERNRERDKSEEPSGKSTQKIYTIMFIAALFIIDKNENNPNV